MSELELAARLHQLQQILGQSVSIRDPSEVAEETLEMPEMEREDKPSWELCQTKDDVATQTGFTWGQEPPAKRDRSPCQSPSQQDPSATADFDRSSLCAGETVGNEVEFCSWKTILAYPTNFIGKTNRPRAQPFFDSILVGRIWDFFYLHQPAKPDGHPHLLVPSAQFQDFLRTVNQALDIALKLPAGANRDIFCLKFGEGGTPQPRYLLSSHDKTSLELDAWPAILDSDLEKFQNLPETQQATFARTIAVLTMPRNYLDKKRKAQNRADQRAKNRGLMMRQTQTHLGLREGGSSRRVIFVCIDAEAIELAPHPVSEIGIAILDSDDISGVAPGPGGSGWWQFIKAHHLRTKEYSGLVNRKYVLGCPDAFDFGVSIFPRKGELADAVMLILKPYADGRNDLVFVAHDTKQDVRYLSSIGVEILDLPGMVGEVDTTLLHQEWLCCLNTKSLAAVLSDLGIVNKNLHNAGNDAVYTLRAMTGLAVEHMRKAETVDGQEYTPALWTA